MKAVRLGLVGSGGMAAKRAAAFASLEDCRPVVLAARNRSTGAELARRHGLELLGSWEELLQRSDVDAVAVCTSNDSHGPIARAALEAGKHVFLEYPLARRLEEGETLLQAARSSGKVLRVAHGEAAAPAHRRLKGTAREMGGLLVAMFARLTPGRGARPEVLFNLPVSGPPALFFVYHVYPLVDLFGPAAWVEGYTHYEGLDRQGTYERFVNRAVVGFAGGGSAEWTWAGGIAIHRAEQYQRLVLEGGTLVHEDGGWLRSTPEGVVPLPPVGEGEISLERLFVDEVQGAGDGWSAELDMALESIRIGLGAERAAAQGRRLILQE